MGTVIASLVLAAMFALAVRSLYKDMKTGGCCGGCSGCSGCKGATGSCSCQTSMQTQNPMQV